MRYLLLIYQEPSVQQPSGDGPRQMSEAYLRYTEWLQGTGQWLGGEALQPVSDATTVSVRDGRRIVTDGPFAETKEHLGGYYLIDAADLDSAIEAAARLPGAQTGKIEIRPIMEFA